MGRAEAVAIALWACPGHRQPWAGSSPQASAGWCRLWFEWFSTWSHGGLRYPLVSCGDPGFLHSRIQQDAVG